MNHSFNVELAEKYGIEEAILIENIAFWVRKSMANYFEDEYWTFNSSRAFKELFPYIHEKKIQRTLVKLEKLNILKSGNFNKQTYDRTKWYCIVDDEIKKMYNIVPKAQKLPKDKMSNGLVENVQSNGKNCPMDWSDLSNGLVENVQPIPYIITDINTDINHDHEEHDSELDIFEKLFKEKYKVNFTKTNQGAIKTLLKKQSVKDVIAYLDELFENIKSTPGVNNIQALFTAKLKKGERQLSPGQIKEIEKKEKKEKIRGESKNKTDEVRDHIRQLTNYYLDYYNIEKNKQKAINSFMADVDKYVPEYPRLVEEYYNKLIAAIDKGA